MSKIKGFENESDMDFTPLDNGKSIYIEGTSLYKSLGEDVKSVEFLTLRGKALYFIEAKTTMPNAVSIKDEKKFEEDFQDLYDKFRHSLDLFASKKLGIHNDSEGEFPECFDKTPFVIKFLLVIRNSEKEWCLQVKEKLEEKLLSLMKIWKVQVFVWNSDEAIKKGFVKGLL
ncbi:MAG: hypothetical protein FWB74_07755 [Defluviitaleaceae bacterium]|nr:hypothetical protein [Defluviitaleaceae bacterium]